MPDEFTTPVKKKIFHWLRRRYHFRSQLTAASYFDAFATRIDFLFRDRDDRKIGIVGRNISTQPLTGIGAFAWKVSENALFEKMDGTLDGVILVILVANPTKARKARSLIANHIATKTPKTLVNDLVIGYMKKKFEPVYLERSIF